MPGEVGHDKQQIAEFLKGMVRVARLAQFLRLFGDLVDHLIGRGPVKPHPRGALLQFDRAHQGRQPHGHAIQHAGFCLCGALGGLYLLPVAGLLFGALVAALGAKDMRVPGDHLVGHGVGHLVEGEQPCLSRHLGVEHRLEEQITQLAFQVVPGFAFDGIGDFMGFFDGIGRDGGEGLFDVPGAAGVRVAQAAHDLQKAGHAALGVLDQIVRHCAGP